jgi:hypothetical protein
MTAQPKSAGVTQVLIDDLRVSRYSRAEVAIKLSEITGRPVSENNIDLWTAPSKPHRFPAELVSAWVRVTGSRRVLELLCEEAGLCAMDAKDLKFAELGRAQIEREKADARLQHLKGELWR